MNEIERTIRQGRSRGGLWLRVHDGAGMRAFGKLLPKLRICHFFDSEEAMTLL
jgi:hypothetical protein